MVLYVFFFFPKNWLWVWIWFLKALVDGLYVASRVNFKITKYPKAETPEKERLRVTFGRCSWEKEKEEAIKPEPLSPIAALSTTTIFFAATSLSLVWVGFFLLFFFFPSNHPCASQCLSFIVWFKFQGYQIYETFGGLGRVGCAKMLIWSKLVLRYF